jgi:hypothetical protein
MLCIISGFLTSRVSARCEISFPESVSHEVSTHPLPRIAVQVEQGHHHCTSIPLAERVKADRQDPAIPNAKLP